MLIDTSLGKLKVWWEHFPPVKDTRKNGRGLRATEGLQISGVLAKRSIGRTICWVVTTEGKPQAQGGALCSVSDQFKKEKGRVVSLRRALTALGLPGEEIGKVFWQYHNRPRGNTQVPLKMYTGILRATEEDTTHGQAGS